MPRNTDSPQIKEQKTTTNNRQIWQQPHTPLLALIAILLALILLGGAFALGRDSYHMNNRSMMGWSTSTNDMPEFGHHMMGNFLNTSDRVVGVVTAVNGSHFTVASNGAIKDVQTDNSTQYQGGSSVKQNDSVVVFGSDNNSQFTADRVIINP